MPFSLYCQNCLFSLTDILFTVYQTAMEKCFYIVIDMARISVLIDTSWWIWAVWPNLRECVFVMTTWWRALHRAAGRCITLSPLWTHEPWQEKWWVEGLILSTSTTEVWWSITPCTSWAWFTWWDYNQLASLFNCITPDYTTTLQDCVAGDHERCMIQGITIRGSKLHDTMWSHVLFLGIMCWITVFVLFHCS